MMVLDVHVALHGFGYGYVHTLMISSCIQRVGALE